MVAEGMSKGQFRIGLLAGYMSLFDELMGPEFRNDRVAWAERVRSIAATEGDVIFPGPIASFEDAERARIAFLDQRVDMVLAAPTMASPPGYSWRILQDLPDTPIVVWVSHDPPAMPPDWTHRDLVRHSATVGAVMLTNTLLRNGRRFHIVTGRLEDQATQGRLRDLLAAARAVARLRRARLGVIGPAIEGYDDVVVDGAALKRDIGPTLVEISKEELTEAVKGVRADQVRQLEDEIRARYQVGPLRPEDLQASLRLAVALDDLCERHDLSGGAINCRTDIFAYNPEVATIGCFAITHATTNGRPFTCTGDVVTAVAMLLTQALGGEAFYHEWDMIDYERGLVWMANTGESDCRLADPAHPVCVIASQGHSGQFLPGASIFHHLRPGPATIVGFSPNLLAPKGWAIVWAEGETIGTEHTTCRVPNGLFRLASGRPEDAFSRWCQGGAPHHASLSSGHLGRRLQAVAEMLGIGGYAA